MNDVDSWFIQTLWVFIPFQSRGPCLWCLYLNSIILSKFSTLYSVSCDFSFFKSIVHALLCWIDRSISLLIFFWREFIDSMSSDAIKLSLHGNSNILLCGFQVNLRLYDVLVGQSVNGDIFVLSYFVRSHYLLMVMWCCECGF